MDSTVLFVDDDPHITETFLRLFRKEPFGMLIANSAKDAIAIIQTQNIQLIITDYRMAKMSGIGFLTELRKKNIFIPSLLLSGDINIPDFESHAEELHIRKILQKPINPLELKKVILESLQL